MGNIDEKTISLLLEKIDSIKSELLALEDEVKALFVADEIAPAEEPAEEPVDVPVPVPERRPEPVEGLVEGPVEGPVEESVDEPVPELVEGPVEGPVEEAPLDITISDIEMPVPPVIEPADEPSGEEVPAEEETIAADIIDDIPDVTPVPERRPERRPEPAEGPAEVPEVRKAILDTAKADTAVMDVMAEKQAWRTDRPGMPVKNIISGISLNDRVLLINVLFREDPMLFQETISKLNAMGSLNEALAYISDNYPEWDLNSEPVYRLMMAVRRKLN